MKKPATKKALGAGNDQRRATILISRLPKSMKAAQTVRIVADHERHTDDGVGSHVLPGFFHGMPAPVRHMINRLFVHIIIRDTEPGNRKIQTKSTKCQKRPDTSTRLV